MLVVNRFRVDVAQPGAVDDFLDQARAALAALAARPGWRSGRLGRNSDEAGLFALVTDWVDVGSYRRALSDYQVKMSAVPLMYRALDEPGAYEVALEVTDGEVVEHPSDLAGPGEATR